MGLFQLTRQGISYLRSWILNQKYSEPILLDTYSLSRARLASVPPLSPRRSPLPSMHNKDHLLLEGKRCREKLFLDARHELGKSFCLLC